VTRTDRRSLSLRNEITFAIHAVCGVRVRSSICGGGGGGSCGGSGCGGSMDLRQQSSRAGVVGALLPTVVGVVVVSSSLFM